MDFIYRIIRRNKKDIGNFEIEAKLGTVVDLNTNCRLQLPVQNECVVLEDSNIRIRFESDMSMEQHRKFNHLLNKAFMESEKPGRVPMKHKHRKEIDRFYEEQTVHQARGRKERIRITTDSESNSVLALVKKERIGDLNILSPRTSHDYRISISVEHPIAALPTNSEMVDERVKDRISYSHQIYQIDLTQVSVRGKVSKHELEIELDSKEVLRQTNLVASGDANDYDIICKSFLDNIRILAREP